MGKAKKTYGLGLVRIHPRSWEVRRAGTTAALTYIDQVDVDLAFGATLAPSTPTVWNHSINANINVILYRGVIFTINGPFFETKISHFFSRHFLQSNPSTNLNWNC